MMNSNLDNQTMHTNTIHRRKSIVSIGMCEHFMLMASIFFYPISLANHIIFLMPLGILMGLAFLNSNKSLLLSDYAAILCGIVACIIPFAVEMSASSPSQELTSKLVVNVIAIILIAGNNRLYFTPQTLKTLKYICYAWFIIVIAVYLKSGVTSVGAVVSQLNSGSDVDSSSLYGIAEPLRDVFLTKNISAMFVVSTFSLYLFISVNLNKKIGFIDFIIFFTVSLSFLSRQAIMGMIVLYGFYRFIIAGRFSKVAVIAIFAIFAAFFFSHFFDLKNSNDGASQRLLLWKYFFEHYQNFLMLGNGVTALNNMLNFSYQIDNFHMFFMNQIGAYGLLHFISFTLFLLFIFFRKDDVRGKVILLAGYLLNVCFQTYGYEYGNLFLFLCMYIKSKGSDHSQPLTAER